ncbi:alpha/beta fold hydrolase [Nocardioides stalactiti]|uniref:alpha/beta fold hydrolase n=1 Tax=Nocardioides stalactiti TaxID=2755356 RepID=UPI001603B8A9|nr:alpha/beta hydrolase [Nocardioides stalactiti]
MARRSSPVVALGFATALLMTGCSGSADSQDAGADRQPSTEPSTEPSTADPSSAPGSVADVNEYVDAGDYDVYVRCWGDKVDDEPTVLLVSGATLTIESWWPMALDLAREGHHVCGYDRAGVGNSYPPVAEERDLEDQVGELEAVLDGSDLNEPVVLAGHSAGVFPIIGAAGAYADRIAGIVLVDAQPPRLNTAQIAALPPERPGESQALQDERVFLGEVITHPEHNPERLVEIRRDEQAIALLDQPGPLFGDLPVVVLQAPLPTRPEGLPDSYHEATVAAINASHEELAAESSNGELIFVKDTGHSIQQDRPEVVMRAIRDVLAR